MSGNEQKRKLVEISRHGIVGNLPVSNAHYQYRYTRSVARRYQRNNQEWTGSPHLVPDVYNEGHGPLERLVRHLREGPLVHALVRRAKALPGVLLPPALVARGHLECLPLPPAANLSAARPPPLPLREGRAGNGELEGIHRGSRGDLEGI
eukprot:931750-Prorocentrum_minimum.AAC.2